MDLREVLERVRAPKDLVDWSPTGLSTAWAECPRGSWLVWIAGATGLPLRDLLLCVADYVQLALEGLSEVEPLDDAVETVLDSLDGEATGAHCVEAADECEALSQNPPTGYRGLTVGSYPSLAMAAAWLARAADGLLTARARAEQQRLDRAAHLGAMLGTGMQIFVHEEPEVALNADDLGSDSMLPELAYVVASLAETMAAIERASAPGASGSGDVAQREAWSRSAEHVRSTVAFRG